MRKMKSITLKEDYALEEGGYRYHCWKFINPKGAQVRCEAIVGTGEIYLYKNNVKIGPQYQISAEPGPTATAVHLNTGSWDIIPAAMSVTLMQGDTLLKIARRFGVSINNLLAINALSPSAPVFPGMALRIPNSEWEVWIKELTPGKNKFKVVLLSK